MNDLVLFIFLFVVNLAFCALLSGIMYVLQYRKSIRPMGIIFVGKTKKGTNTWEFRFNEGVTYDMIANMNSVRFKIVKREFKEDDCEP